KCRPFKTARELCSILIVAIYIPPRANAKLALEELYCMISLQMNNNPEAAVIVAGDFNHVELKAVFPKFHRYINFPTRDNNTLDQVYCNIPGAYKDCCSSTPGHVGPHLCESDPCLQTSDLQDKTNHQNCTGFRLRRRLQHYRTALNHQGFSQIKQPWLDSTVKPLLKACDACLQFSLQHSDPRQADTEAPQPGTALIAVPLDQGLPHQQASGGENRGQHASSTLVLSTGTPQGCVLSPALFTLFTSDCSAIHSTNTIAKFAEDTTIVGLISDNDETHYREHLTQWCSNNNLVLNTSKTKEVIVDYRRSRRTEHAPLLIHGEAVERVNNIKFLGIHITSDLTWSMNTAHL
ncbi:hypothetical protein L3Q82_012337, partial [Scortum barcoo]